MDDIKKPYIFKCIKQNLQNISLNCDTDDDEEWIDENLNQTINTTTKILRPRSKIILSLNSSESDEDDESDSSSFVQEENLDSSKEIVEGNSFVSAEINGKSDEDDESDSSSFVQEENLDSSKEIVEGDSFVSAEINGKSDEDNELDSSSFVQEENLHYSKEIVEGDSFVSAEINGNEEENIHSSEETNDNDEEDFNSSEKSNESIISNASAEENYQGNLIQSQISLTPPPPMTYSPINNVHLDFAKKVLADGRRICNQVKPIESKRISCSNCSKTFIRINTHKCKGIKTVPLI